MTTTSQVIISRIATHNPDINGQKLYLTGPGMWTLDRSTARKLDRELAEDFVALANAHPLKIEEA